MPGTAGPRSHRVTFLRQAAGNGTRGQRTGPWETLHAVWAEVIQSPGRELSAARQRFEATSLLLRVLKPRRWTPTTADRVTHRGATYEIGAIWEPNQDGFDLFIACSGVN